MQQTLIGRNGPIILALILLAAGCVTGPTPKEIKQAEIAYDLGVNDLGAGKVPAALKSFMEALEHNPDFPQAYNGLGLAHHLLGNSEKAIASYQKALELKPDFSEVRNNLARVYISRGHHRKAIPILRKALEDVFLRERYLAESNLGWALFQIGKEEEGIRHVRNALAMNDKLCVGYEYMGLMHQNRKHLEEAVREFEELVKRCPDYPAGQHRLAKALLMTGEVERGCKALQACRKHSRLTQVGNDCDRLFRLSCSETPGDSGDGSTPSPPGGG